MQGFLKKCRWPRLSLRYIHPSYLVLSVGFAESDSINQGLCRIKMFKSESPDDLKKNIQMRFKHKGYMPDDIGKIVLKRLVSPPAKPAPPPPPPKPACSGSKSRFYWRQRVIRPSPREKLEIRWQQSPTQQLSILPQTDSLAVTDSTTVMPAISDSLSATSTTADSTEAVSPAGSVTEPSIVA